MVHSTVAGPVAPGITGALLAALPAPGEAHEVPDRRDEQGRLSAASPLQVPGIDVPILIGHRPTDVVSALDQRPAMRAWGGGAAAGAWGRAGNSPGQSRLAIGAHLRHGVRLDVTVRGGQGDRVARVQVPQVSSVPGPAAAVSTWPSRTSAPRGQRRYGFKLPPPSCSAWPHPCRLPAGQGADYLPCPARRCGRPDEVL
jgi:hypothetical protein